MFLTLTGAKELNKVLVNTAHIIHVSAVNAYGVEIQQEMPAANTVLYLSTDEYMGVTESLDVIERKLTGH